MRKWKSDEIVSTAPNGRYALRHKRSSFEDVRDGEAWRGFTIEDITNHQSIGALDLPNEGASEVLWNPTGTAVALVRRYSTHYYGVLIYSLDANGKFAEVIFDRPRPLEVYKQSTANPVTFILPTSDARIVGWSGDSCVHLIELTQEVGGDAEGKIPDRSLFASYLLKLHGNHPSVTHIELFGPSTYQKLTDHFHLPES